LKPRMEHGLSAQMKNNTVGCTLSILKAILALSFLLILSPPIVHSESATSRWDLVVGGYVKFEMGLTDQGRHGFGGYESIDNKYGNFTTTSTGTRINFLTRGPDAWNAKTIAFMEGDFIGVYTGAGRGTFGLRQAFMSFQWQDSRVIVGQTFQKWGFLPTYALAVLAGQDLSPFVKGHRQPLIRAEHNISQNWNISFALLSPTNTLGSNRSSTESGVVDSFTLSGMPFYEASLGWSTDRLGKIGAWKTLFNIDGFYGRQKQVVTLTTGPSTAPSSISYGDKDVNCWGLALKGFIPVIPENKGDKGGSLSLSGVLFTARNPSWLQSGAFAVSSYARPGETSSAPAQPASDPLPDFVTPRMYGVWGQITYFLTDKLFANGWYGYLRNDTSRNFDAAVSGSTGAFIHRNTVQNVTQYIVSLCYDVNPAIRLSAEYSYFITRYANYATAYDGSTLLTIASKDATQQALRVGAWYFF
jgi:hypothetical protein